MKAKKTNSYIKFALTTVIAAVFGGMLGVGSVILYEGTGGEIEAAGMALMAQLQHLLFPLLCGITVVSVAMGEWNIRRLKYICDQVIQHEDEECDRWEYEEEKMSAIGMNTSILSQVCCIIILSLGYSIKYLEEGNSIPILYSCIVFIICLTYDGFWQVRLVKAVQRAHPEKLGDPASRKFQQQWLESCDEAEKEVVYQSAYKSYIAVNKSVPILIFVTMLLHLFFDTGILAVIVVSVVWVLTTMTYTRSCVKMRKMKIRNS